MPVIFTRKPFTWAVLHALLQNIACACTLVRKRENETLEVVFPLETCEIADGKTLFRFFNWDTIGGRRPHDKDSPYPLGSYDVSSWDAVRAMRPIKLNFGGGSDKHPRANYKGYVAVEALDNTVGTMGPHCSQKFPWCGSYCVCYDPGKSLPLLNNTVSQILCEHVLEHVAVADIPGILAEWHRVLRPGGWARVAVPDYWHPRLFRNMIQGMNLGQSDPENPRHITFTRHSLLKELTNASPFGVNGAIVFHEYWDRSVRPKQHVVKKIDYKQGFVKRSSYLKRKNAQNAGKKLKPTKQDSVIFDLIKLEPAGMSQESIQDADRLVKYYTDPTWGYGRAKLLKQKENIERLYTAKT